VSTTQPATAAVGGRPGARSATVIDRCRAEGRAALICYLPVGYPDVATSVEAAKAMATAGADIIELGIPYSDPVMDGPVIAGAVDMALRGGVRVADAFAAAAAVTTHAPGVAVLLMTYWNPVARLGVAEFAARAAAAGTAGLITPDLLPDSAEEWLSASTAHDLERVFLVAPSSPAPRLALAAQASTGFVYAASTMGVTGARSSVAPAAQALVQRVRDAGADRVCVGLGVSTGAQAAEVAGYADGVIVGSALVAVLAGADRATSGASHRLAAVRDLVSDLAAGVRAGRVVTRT